VWQALFLDWHLYLENDILAKVDRASMACSLEVRVPLLNIELVEFVASLPLNLKLRGLTRKYLLRKALAGRIPQATIDRPKKGFGIPVGKWLRNELRPLLLDTLSPARLREGGLFEPAAVQSMIDAHLSGQRDNRKQLWTLLVFELWRQRWGAAAA
jgi:asparagine synthase (glutamine-hydrolysing)